jgi:hypothetical protein
LKKRCKQKLPGQINFIKLSHLEHHNKILKILNAFNPEVLKQASAQFAGGTLLALEYDEYRLSKDIDFLIPYGTENYRWEPVQRTGSPLWFI